MFIQNQIPNGDMFKLYIFSYKICRYKKREPKALLVDQHFFNLINEF